MKIPQHIKIGNLSYSIGDLDEEDDGAFGRSNQRYQWIKLSKNIKDDRKFQTLLHEVIHQILDNNDYFKESEDERLIDCLSAEIFQVLKDNGFLAKSD